MRVALGVEYDGSGYVGWQRQKTGTGVQALVEKAISAVADEPVECFCAGRTDAGVHASGQVIHFDTAAERSTRGWLLGVNSGLPSDININWAHIVHDEFHARFSAVSRSYRYLILNRPARSALHRQRAWWVYEPLDENLMQQAASTLLGRHDFSAFRAAGCQASTPERDVMAIDVRRRDDWIVFTITANAFLQHMVRNITGTLVAIGRGEQSTEWLGEVLRIRDRKEGGIAAPPHGLTLTAVSYPERFGIPDSGNGQLALWPG